MIYDCCPFFNELDLLEIRLNELNDVVDRFVIVEAELTHNGEKKPLYFEDDRERFSKFENKIRHIIVRAEEFKPAEAGATFQERAWMRGNIQRNAIALGLNGARDDDVVIVSDLDEIPRASCVSNTAREIETGEVVGFILNAYNFYANLRNASNPYWGNDPKMSKIATFRDERAYVSSPYRHFILPEVNQGPTATRFRYIKPTWRIANAGWHFSYLGGVERVARKIRSIVENDWSRNMSDAALLIEVKNRIDQRKALGDILTGGGCDAFMPEPFDNSFPEFLIANSKRFSYLVYQNVPPQNARVRLLRKWIFFSACVRRFAMRIVFWLTPRWVRTIVKRIIGVPS